MFEHEQLNLMPGAVTYIGWWLWLCLFSPSRANITCIPGPDPLDRVWIYLWKLPRAFQNVNTSNIQHSITYYIIKMWHSKSNSRRSDFYKDQFTVQPFSCSKPPFRFHLLKSVSAGCFAACKVLSLDYKDCWSKWQPHHFSIWEQCEQNLICLCLDMFGLLLSLYPNCSPQLKKLFLWYYSFCAEDAVKSGPLKKMIK